MPNAPIDIVRRFWQIMGENDFELASQCLTEDFRLHWPQTGEVLEGRRNFAELNAAYPAEGLWRFDLRKIVADGMQVVTEVGVTDGARRDTAITFHTVREDLIAMQREFWPDPYDAPEWRSSWVRQPKL